jgi:2-oxoisovalerate dehydrogenase E1 component
MRCASLDTPVPFAAALEKNFLAKTRLHQYIQQLNAY